MKKPLSIPYPSTVFIFCIMIFNLFPTLAIILTDYEPQRRVLSKIAFDSLKWDYFQSFFLYFIVFLTMFVVLKIFFHKNIKLVRRSSIPFDDLKRIYKETKITISILIMFCVICIALHAFNGGLSKLTLLGSDIGGRDFRFKGFDDIPRIYLILLAITRRFVLPFIILYLGIVGSLKLASVSFLYWFLVLLQLFACSLTFARAPFLTLILVIAIPHLIFGGKIKRLFSFSLLVMSVIVVAGVVTNLQYNIVKFSVTDVLTMGWNFFYNRMLFVPNVVPIHDAFSLSEVKAEPLYLRYSRIGALFYGSAIGTNSSLSIYVSPVGYVGDVFRNFHYFGLPIFALMTSVLFCWLDGKFENQGILQNIFLFFGILALIFYWIMGVVFSMGAVFSLCLVLGLSNRYVWIRRKNG